MRLDKFLAHAGLGTRSRVRQMIRHARVQVNGQIERDPATQVDVQDSIVVNKQTLTLLGPRVFAFHKPAGLVTSTQDPQATIYAVLPFDPKKMKPIGRLDKETDGLLLITDDGDLNHGLCSPRHHVEKEYVAELDREIQGSDLAALKEPMILERGLRVRAAIEVEKLSARKIRLVIDEGKYHQVRRMCAKLGLRVEKLQRTRVGPISLGTLARGAHRELSKEEIQALRREAGLKTD